MTALMECSIVQMRVSFFQAGRRRSWSRQLWAKATTSRLQRRTLSYAPAYGLLLQQTQVTDLREHTACLLLRDELAPQRSSSVALAPLTVNTATAPTYLSAGNRCETQNMADAQVQDAGHLQGAP